MMGEKAQPMSTPANSIRIHWKASPGFQPAIQAEGTLRGFDFARVRKQRPPGSVHYLILARRDYAERTKVSWACRNMAN
jgi:hypothetical protein